MLTESYRTVDLPDRRVVRYSNGLTAILARHDAAPTAAVRVYVRGGSALEGVHSGAGLSHLFEHLVTCDGAGPYSEGELMQLADELGGLVNAYTTTDHICYHANVAAEGTVASLNLLAQYVVAPRLSREVFDRELGVVQRELERDRDDPETQLEELVQELLYEGRPHAAPVIGYRDRLVTLTHADLVAHHQRVHTGENVIVVVAGDIGIDAISSAIAASFSGLSRGLRIDECLDDPAALVAPRRVTRRMDVESASITIAFPTVRERDIDDVPLDLLAAILFDGDDARLVKRLRWDEERVYDIGGAHDSASFARGSLQITAQCDVEDIERVESAIVDELAKLAKRPVTRRELERARQQTRTTILYHRETAEGYATQLGEDFLATGDIAYCEAYLARVAAVTTNEVAAAAQRHLIDRPYVSARIVPRTDTLAPSHIQTDPAAATFRKELTDEGLTLLARSLPHSAFVAVSINLLGGVVAESPEHSGAFHALASIWTRGSAQLTANELAAAFAERGASIRATTGLNQFGLSFIALAEDFEKLWPLFVDTLLSPSLSQAEWKKARRAILDSIARQDESWHSELVRFAREQFFTDSPYRQQRFGTRESIGAVTAKSLRTVYDRFVHPGNAVLSVAGQIDIDCVIARIRNDLGQWSLPGGRWQPAKPDEVHTGRDRVFVKESSGDREVAGVFIGYPGLSYADRVDRAAVTVFDTMLAGYSLASGRLYHALRGSDNDLAYEVAGIGFSGLLPGYIAYTSGCEPARVNEVSRVMRAQIEAIRTGAFDEAEVGRAKAMIRAGELDQLQSAAEIAVRTSVDEVLGLGADDWKVFLDEVDAASIDSVRQAAGRYLNHPTIVVTTPTPDNVRIEVD